MWDCDAVRGVVLNGDLREMTRGNKMMITLDFKMNGKQTPFCCVLSIVPPQKGKGCNTSICTSRNCLLRCYLNTWKGDLYVRAPAIVGSVAGCATWRKEELVTC